VQFISQSLQLLIQFDAKYDVITTRKLGINQQQFWSRLGVTQSGGSRYESGRDIPLPVLMLLHIAYAPEKQAANLVGYLWNVESDKPGKI